MQKIVILLLIVLYATSCSVLKQRIENNSDKTDIETNIISLNEISRKNLTTYSFFIQKAEIEIINKGEKQKFIASLKFNKPDSFLITLRSIAGIEAARVFLTRDTILINDRINKVLYFGSQADAKNKYGFSSLIFPALIGDLIIDEMTETAVKQCIEGIMEVGFLIDGYGIKYLIDCKRMNSFSVSIIREIDSKAFYVKFEDYDKSQKVNFARSIKISDIYNIENINVRFVRIQIPWEGRLNFVPGDSYEQIEIK